MNLLKTKFYPVDGETGKIYLDPFDREKDLANKWSRGEKPCIGLRGGYLMSHQCYHKFKPVPTVTQESLLRDWEAEAS